MLASKHLSSCSEESFVWLPSRKVTVHTNTYKTFIYKFCNIKCYGMCFMIYYAIYSYLTDSTNISQISSCLFLWLILFWGIGYFVETVSGSISNVTTLKCFLPRLNPSKLQYSSYSAYYSVNQITEKANGLWHKMRTTCYIKKPCNQTAKHFRQWKTELSHVSGFLGDQSWSVPNLSIVSCWNKNCSLQAASSQQQRWLECVEHTLLWSSSA